MNWIVIVTIVLACAACAACAFAAARCAKAYGKTRGIEATLFDLSHSLEALKAKWEVSSAESAARLSGIDGRLSDIEGRLSDIGGTLSGIKCTAAGGTPGAEGTGADGGTESRELSFGDGSETLLLTFGQV